MSGADPNSLLATEAIEFIKQGKLSVGEWTLSCIEQVERHEPSLRAWRRFDREALILRAREIERRIEAGAFDGSLWGAPFGVKDVINTVDFPTCMGSPIWEGFTPGNDARVVSHLKREGGLMFGKTVTAEFAVHHPGPTVNPHHLDYSPGTSSSGSAASVAACMVPLAVGTQTAGSTIRPASYSGVYGFKPSFGVVPRTGILKTLDTLDHVSFFARSIADLRLALESARVRGANHPYVKESLDDWSPSRARPPYRVAFVKGPGWERAEAYAKDAVSLLASRLSRCRDVELREAPLPPALSQAHDVHALLYSKGLSYYFNEEYESRRDQLSDVFLEMVERGRRITAEQYWEALKRQESLKAALSGFFEDFDMILNLSTSGRAPRGIMGRDKKDNCLLWTLCHVPALSAPAFESPDGLPFGAQLVARRYDDLSLLKMAEDIQEQGFMPPWRPLAPYKGARK